MLDISAEICYYVNNNSESSRGKDGTKEKAGPAGTCSFEPQRLQTGGARDWHTKS